MPIFTGINRHTLDKQNRLFVPSKMREELGRDIVLFKPTNGDKCIYIYPQKVWEENQKDINNEPDGTLRTIMQRLYAQHSDKTEMAPQGRVTVNPEFVEYAGFAGEVIIVGAGQRIEIWNPDNYAEMMKRCEDITFDIRY